MGRASRRKWEAQIQLLLEKAVKQNKPGEGDNNLLWVFFSTGIAILLTVVGSMVRDLRFLFIAAWLCFGISAWLALKPVRLFKKRILYFSGIILLLAGGLYGLAMWLEPSSVPAGSTPAEIAREIAKLIPKDTESPKEKPTVGPLQLENRIIEWLTQTNYKVCRADSQDTHFDLRVASINNDPVRISYFKDRERFIQILGFMRLSDLSKRRLDELPAAERLQFITDLQMEMFRIPEIGFEGLRSPLPAVIAIYTNALVDDTENEFLRKVDNVSRARRIAITVLQRKLNLMGERVPIIIYEKIEC